MNVYMAWKHYDDKFEPDSDVVAVCSTPDKAKLACLKYETDRLGYSLLEWTQYSDGGEYYLAQGEYNHYSIVAQLIDEMILVNEGEKL